jgi:hypothetical protein
MRESTDRVLFREGKLMLKTFKDDSLSVLTRVGLLKLKRRAMRAGVWFKALSRIDRVLVDLTIKVVDAVSSRCLAKSILTVVRKLDGLLESNVLSSLRLVGRSLAEKFSLIAQKWGNTSAKSWASNESFAVFLAIMQRNR